MRKVIILCAILVGAVFAGGIVLVGKDDYEVQLLMPSADAAFEGGQVLIKGEPVGQVKSIEARDGQALVTVRIGGDRAPLHAGTSARVKWTSVIGARVIELLPGNEDNPELESGTMITAATEAVELDQVLAALDSETRRNLQGLVSHLEGIVDGREPAINQTVDAAGPTFAALGEILRAVGEDGPAIRELVTELHKITEGLAMRDDEVAGTISDLDAVVRAMAQQKAALSAALQRVPNTIGQATDTLDSVEPAVGKTQELLRDLQPAAARLPSVASRLSPVLQRLRPVTGDLRGVLDSASVLLQDTPQLLDTAHGTLPGVTAAVDETIPIVTFLRPYTPEVVGWLANWTSLFASQNRSGNYARTLITASASSVDVYPDGVVPPGMQRADEPLPGSIAGQPWIDANGDEVR